MHVKSLLVAGSSNVRLQPTKCGSDHKGPSLPPIHSPSKVRLQLPHCESGNKYASPPLMNRNAQSPSTDNCNSLSLTHSNAESLVPGLKPITPDSPEPRLAYSPRALQDRPAAHASRQSASESTTSNAFQPLLGTTAHAVAHAEALAMQHNSPAWQAKSVADTKSPAALRSAAKHQLIIPARQPRGAADATSPSGRQCNSKRGLLHSLTKTHATVPAAVERTPDTKQASLKPKAKSQHTISNPPVSCRAQNARSKALPGWNSDFSIQYQDPVSIKDQERLHSRASDTHTLPPVARPHKGKGRSPTACAVDIKQQRRQYAVSVETDDVARDDGGQWLTEGCSRKGDEHMTSKVMCVACCLVALFPLLVMCLSEVIKHGRRLYWQTCRRMDKSGKLTVCLVPAELHAGPYCHMSSLLGK